MSSQIAIYRDGDRWIVGPAGQRTRSATDGWAVCWSPAEAAEVAAELAAWRVLPPPQMYETPDRFEAAEEAGLYGAPW